MDKDTQEDNPDVASSDNSDEAKAENDAPAKDVSAEHAAAQAEVMLEGARQHRENQTTKSRNMILVAILIAIIGAIGVFFFIGSGEDDSASSDAATDTDTSEAAEAEQTPVATATEFSQIVYANSSAENLPRALFTRPVAGGERVDQEFNFGRNAFLNVTRDGASYAVLSDDGDVYVATGSDTPEMVASGVSPEAQMLFDAQAGSILLIELDTNADVITLTEVLIDGSSSEFYTESGVIANAQFIIGQNWNASSGELILTRSCYACDGVSSDLLMLDREGTESTVFAPPEGDGGIPSQFVFNDDGTKALFSVPTEYPEGNEFGIVGGLGAPQGAPFAIFEVDIASGSSSAVNTIGDPEDVNDSGFFSYPILFWADTEAGPQRVAYSYQELLFVENGQGNFDNFFQTEQGEISSIYAVDEDELLVGAGSVGDEVISYYNVTERAGAIVMETLPTTSILTVSLE